MRHRDQKAFLRRYPRLVPGPLLALFIALGLGLGLIGIGLLWQSRQPTVVPLLSATPQRLDAQPARYAALADVIAQPDSTAALEILGNPAAQRYPDCAQSLARNPWDLAAFAGRLYLGLGNASNDGPSPNAGPVPVYVFDPASATFRQETTLPEEQIDRFYRHDGALWLPGDDPRQSWRNLYRREAAGGWTQYRTLPRTIHAYALAWHQDRLFAGVSVTEAVPAGVGTQRFGSAVAVSADGGAHWELFPLGGWRIFDFLTVRGQLFAADIVPGPGIQSWLEREQRQQFHAPLYEYVGADGFRRRTDLDAASLFPDTPRAGRRAAVIQQALAWHNGTVYLGAFAWAADEEPVRGAYLARNLTRGEVQVERLLLPADALAMDLRVADDTLQVLFAEPLEQGRWRNSLWSSRDARHWEPLLSFSAAGPARSFERLGEDWYLGLGSLSEPAPGPAPGPTRRAAPCCAGGRVESSDLTLASLVG